MNRRTLLAVGGAGLGVATAGCLGGPVGDIVDGEPEPLEQCDRIEIAYDSLPNEVQTEVDVALDEGAYETDRLLFAEAIDPERSFVVVDDTPYKPTVERDDTSEQLTLTDVDTPRLPSPRTVSVYNGDDREHELTIELVDDEPLVSETRTIAPDDHESIETTDRFGSYTLSIDSPTDPAISAEEMYVVDEYHFGAIIERRAEAIAFMQEVAEIAPCPWE